MSSKAFLRRKILRAHIHEQVLAGQIPNGRARNRGEPDGSFHPYTDTMESHRMMAAGHRAPYFERTSKKG